MGCEGLRGAVRSRHEGAGLREEDLVCATVNTG